MWCRTVALGRLPKIYWRAVSGLAWLFSGGFDWAAAWFAAPGLDGLLQSMDFQDFGAL